MGSFLFIDAHSLVKNIHLISALSYSILLGLMKLALCSPSHFTDEKSKAQKGEVMSQRLQLSEVAQGLEYRPLDQVLPLLFTGATE